MAAEYIAKHLKKYNILPLGDNQSYYQKIPRHGSQALPLSQLRFYLTDNGHVQFQLGERYLQYKTGTHTFVSNPTPLVFAGYGIIASECHYNDYRNVEIERKSVAKLKNLIDRQDGIFYFILSFQNIIGEKYE